jgi:uncharacterized membrane protein
VRSDQWLLLAHLASAFVFVSGAVVAGVLQLAAMRRERPSEIALLLGLTRVGVVLVTIGALATLGFGVALAHELDLDLGATWLQGAFVLWVASMALGGVGGRRARHARELAERLAVERDEPSAELRAAVSDRLSLGLSLLSFAAVLAILVLMVWRPT